MKRTKRYACGLIVILSLSSCATIFTGTSDRITFNSTPVGATVYERGIEKCKTPCTLKVTRTLSEKDIEFKKDGYQNRRVFLCHFPNLIKRFLKNERALSASAESALFLLLSDFKPSPRALIMQHCSVFVRGMRCIAALGPRCRHCLAGCKIFGQFQG